VLEEFVEPDLERLFDEARLEFVVKHLQREASGLCEDEIVTGARCSPISERRSRN